MKKTDETKGTYEVDTCQPFPKWDDIPDRIQKAMASILLYIRENNIDGYEMWSDGKNHFNKIAEIQEKYHEIKNMRPVINTSTNERGYVYLIESENGVYKIGKAKNVTERINHFGVKLPIKTTLIHSFSSDGYSRAEKALHNKFGEKRSHGEWFYLSKEDVNYICSIQDGTL